MTTVSGVGGHIDHSIRGGWLLHIDHGIRGGWLLHIDRVSGVGGCST